MLTKIVDYNYYSNFYGGSSIPESSFNKYSIKNDNQPKIKELRKYDKYCKSIKEIAKTMQENINIFDRDIQKRKDNSRSI